MMSSSNGASLDALRALSSIGSSGIVPAFGQLAQRGAMGGYPAAMLQQQNMQQYLSHLPWMLRMQVRSMLSPQSKCENRFCNVESPIRLKEEVVPCVFMICRPAHAHQWELIQPPALEGMTANGQPRTPVRGCVSWLCSVFLQLLSLCTLLPHHAFLPCRARREEWQVCLEVARWGLKHLHRI